MNEDRSQYWQPEPSQAPVEPTPDANSDVPSSIEEPDADSVTWTAQEYIQQDKGRGWYALFALVVLVFLAIDFFVLRSWTFSILVVVMAISVVVYSRRPPRTITYVLSPRQGLYIAEQLYPFENFKAFGLLNDQGHYSIMMIPRKRFMPAVSVFFPPEAGEKIVDVLGKQLPMQELKLDFVDILVRKLRL
ncbi:hypothetical protein B7Y94_05850 [Candidatus Saccharibacteria bacterium 32-49-12]|nr:MAG: hypothetical protein B7Y94_05850 [Candidatus Saccharibacteria bacterium 32-49-12]